ncbi:MAG: elongation factor P--(R)-beta-lysine ligase [Spirochaetales bacterium]|uniref:Elongation factor P--(R)-beta-lysine ligase n=1 Tax=Candidatus Thalassospirochaeta sargassi TaxID=3119039 RepID=A0AAJ1MK32_9SPIO|nr:elongation factor P--(R)-beta-lysine ligase [Spirochaetales bacterium]
MNQNPVDKMKLRAHVQRDIRKFFASRSFTEADVPLLTPGVIPEASIELFKTEMVSPYGSSPEELFLLPSPEYYLKQLIAEGSGDIYSISRSFRNSEQTGRQHNPEFTMLEYYAMDADYIDSISLTEDLIATMLEGLPADRERAVALRPPFRRMTMDETFERFADFDLSAHCSGRLSGEEERKQLKELAEGFGLSTSDDDSWEELFNLVFVHKIEPQLPTDKPLVIYDYPANIPALARPAATRGRLERWELYAGGIELANCYSEETDYKTVKNFFTNEAAEKIDALVTVKPDLTWCEMYRKNFPRCSGTAMGLDRLIMLLSGAASIEGVILFPLSDIIRELN